MISRRAFLGLGLLPVAEVFGAGTINSPPLRTFDRYFLPILEGYLRNSLRTSSSFAVCDFPAGTKLAEMLAKSGKGYIAVSRMLPAIAAWLVSGRQRVIEVDGQPVNLVKVVASIYSNAFDPSHPDYWRPASPDREDQRQDEASLVGWSLWLLRDVLLERLTSTERANVQAWLASCTQVPMRRNNEAWFTAVNQASRLALSKRWREFSGDPEWMRADLATINKMYIPGEGWYSDGLKPGAYDYYNFWAFHSHSLYWSALVGREYPEWNRTFLRRTRQFLERAPYFFGANGSHVLSGRSLIYRWGVLTALVLAYLQGLWPHSPGLLRRIAHRNMEFLWQHGAFDSSGGKLRETLSADGTRDIDEDYIDEGHPYWGMQAFSLYLIPPRDPFWRVPEEPLPVERDDYHVKFPGTQMLLVGARRSGQVRWLRAINSRNEWDYRDKYTKFSYSSHFPFSILNLKNRCAWDAALVFRDPKTGGCAARTGEERGSLTDDGVDVVWRSDLRGLRFRVTTRISIKGEFEHHRHVIESPPEALSAGIEVLEGSYSLGLGSGETLERERERHGIWLRSPHRGAALFSLNLRGYSEIDVAEWFEESRRRDVNIIYPKIAVCTLRAPLRGSPLVLESIHYASPAPLPRPQIMAQIARLVEAPQQK